jgi:hypothetical protein
MWERKGLEDGRAVPMRYSNARPPQAGSSCRIRFRFIGKETDRRWERAEDVSIVELKGIEYRAKRDGPACGGPCSGVEGSYSPDSSAGEKSRGLRYNGKSGIVGKRILRSVAAKVWRAIAEIKGSFERH